MISGTGKMPTSSRLFFSHLLLLLTLIFIAAGLLPASPARADTPLHVRVGLYENKPKIFTDDNGLPAGFWPGLLDHIAEAEGWQLEYISGTWEENMTRLAAGEIDIMPDVAFTEERAGLYAFTEETVHVSWSRVYVKTDTEIDSILDLDGRTLSVMEGSVNVEGPEGIALIIKSFDIDCTLLEVEDYREVFEMVASGQVDGGVVSRDFANRNLDEYGLMGTPILFQPAGLRFAFPQEGDLTPHLIQRIDDQIRELKSEKNSPYYALLVEWLGVAPLQSSTLPKWFYWIIGVLAFLAAAHLVGSLLMRRQVSLRTRLLTAEIEERKKASRLLSESEAKFSVAFRSSPDIIAITSYPEGRFIDVNENYVQVTGYSRESLIGRRIRDIGIWPDSAERDRWRSILEEHQRITGQEFRFRRKSGEIRTWLHSVEPIVINGETCLIAVSSDITELKKQQQLEKDENHVLELLWQQTDLSQVLEAIIRLGERFNPEVKGAIFLTGSTGDTLRLAVAPSLPDEYRELMKEDWQIGPSMGSCGTAAYQKEPVLVPDIRESALFPNRDTMTGMGLLASFSQPILSSQREVLGTIAYYRNRAGQASADTLRILDWSARLAAITIERRKADEALRESEKKYRILVENANDIVYSLNTEGIFTYVSPTWTRILGHKVAEVVGHPFSDFTHPEDTPGALELLGKAMLTEQVMAGVEYRVRHKDGSWRWHISNVSKIIEADGVIVSFMGIARDITERRRNEDALRESEERYRLLAENARDVIYRISLIPELKFDYVSPSVVEMTGYRPEEFYTNPSRCVTAFHPDDMHLLLPLAENPKNFLNQPLTIRWVKKDGTVIWTEQRLTPIYDVDGHRIALEGISRDITERKKAEEVISKSEERYRLLAENARDLIYRISVVPDLKFEYISPSSIEFTGYTPEEHYQDQSLRFRLIHPDDRAKMEEVARNSEYYEGKPVVIRWIKRNGDIIWIEQQNVLIRDENGDIIAMEGIARDISGRKKDEERILHLSRILSSIRSVNQLIVREKNPQSLIEQSCTVLVDTESSSRAMIILTGRDKFPDRYAEAGFGESFSTLVTQLKRGLLPACCLGTETSTGSLPRHAGTDCDGCPLSPALNKSYCLCLPLTHEDISYGFLIVSSDSDAPPDDEETELLKEMTGDIAYALYGIEQEQLLRENEEKFSRAFQSSPDAISISRISDHRFIEVNDSYLSITGFQREDLIGSTALELGMWPFPEEEEEMGRSVRAHRKLRNSEFSFMTKSGAIRSWLMSTEYITLAGEECLLTVSTDVTEKKRTEKALADEANRRSILMEQSGDGIVIMNQDGGVHEANSRFAAMLGYSPEEIKELHVWDWDNQIAPEKLRYMIETVDESGDHFETVHRRKDGGTFPVEISTNGAYIGGQKYIFCICRDITERIKAEQSVRESEEKFSRAFQSSPDAVAISRISDGTFLEVNDSYIRLTGFSREEMIGSNASLLHIWDNPEQEKTITGMIRAGIRFTGREEVLRSRSGERRTWLASSEYFTLAGETCMLMVLTDITERKKNEEALRISDAALKSIHDAVIVVDTRWEITQWNHVSEEMFGLSAAEAIGRHMSEVVSLVEEYPGQNDDSISVLTERGWNRKEQIYRTPRGEIWVDVHTQAIMDEEGKLEGWVTLAVDITERKQSERILTTISENSPIGTFIMQDGKFRHVSPRFCEYLGLTEDEIAAAEYMEYIHPDDRELVRRSSGAMLRGEIAASPYEYRVITPQGEPVWLLETVTAIQFEGKQAVLGNAIDVTNLRKLEKKVIEYEELNKLKTDLLSTVSHELRTPLASIKGYATMLVDYDERLDNEEKKQSLISIDQATDHLMKLVDQLLDMSRMDAGLLRLDKNDTDISRLIHKALAEARLRSPEHTFAGRLPATLPPLPIDTNRIRQVLDNLIDNATKYSAPGTKITVTASLRAREIAVCVADQGPGIPADELDKVFDRLYRIEQRLGPTAGGLGLGLSICKGLVEAHGGRIWAESRKDKGSRFCFVLPR